MTYSPSSVLKNKKTGNVLELGELHYIQVTYTPMWGVTRSIQIEKGTLKSYVQKRTKLFNGNEAVEMLLISTDTQLKTEPFIFVTTNSP